MIPKPQVQKILTVSKRASLLTEWSGRRSTATFQVCEHLACKKVGILERRQVTYPGKFNDLDVAKALPDDLRKYRKVWSRISTPQ